MSREGTRENINIASCYWLRVCPVSVISQQINCLNFKFLLYYCQLWYRHFSEAHHWMSLACGAVLVYNLFIPEPQFQHSILQSIKCYAIRLSSGVLRICHSQKLHLFNIHIKLFIRIVYGIIKEEIIVITRYCVIAVDDKQ